MRKTALVLVPATITIPDKVTTMLTLEQFAAYNARQFNRTTMDNDEYRDLAYFVEECVTYIDVNVDGITDAWSIDKIINDHDDQSREGYSVLLGIRDHFTRRFGASATYNRYLYIRFYPDRGLTATVQYYAHATSDTSPTWGAVIDLFEAV